MGGGWAGRWVGGEGAEEVRGSVVSKPFSGQAAIDLWSFEVRR